MAATSELSPSKILETPINAHDSTSEPHPTPPKSPQINEPINDVVTTEKRKRDDGDGNADGDDKPSLHPMWKTSLCSYFRKHSTCSHGDTCRYAHSEEELRQRPDNTWDPTSERGKKMLKSVTGEKIAVKDGVMMTELVDEVDGDGGGEEGFASNQALSKCLVHLPMKWTSENLRTFLNEQGIPFKHAKTRKGMSIGFVTFEDEEQMKSSAKDLQGKQIGNKTLEVADVNPRSFEKKSNSNVPSSGTLGDETNEDNLVIDGSESKKKSSREVVTPLAHLSYADQLEQKKYSLMQILKKLPRNARKACPNGVSVSEWILKSREIGGLPCNLEGIIESPIVNGYRNKCEFSIGNSLEGKVTVGFSLGNFREGVTAVEEPVDCPNISTIACKYAAIFQEFLQHTELPVWNRFKNCGFWRQLTVREGRSNGNVVDAETFDGIAEVMLIVQVSTSSFDNAQVDAEFKRLAQAFVTGATSHCSTLPLTALIVQDHQGISNVAPSDAPLHSLPITAGDPERDVNISAADVRIHDYISNLRFSISPTSFFQVNTLAAEKLYSLAGDWACLGPDTLLFDICCGTGAIGLTLAHRVGMVIGIEMNAAAVSDAHKNAENNGIKNCSQRSPLNTHFPSISCEPFFTFSFSYLKEKEKMSNNIVVVFDFDKTIIDCDSDNWVIDELGFTDLFNQLLPTMPWNSLMDRMMMEIHSNGKTIEEIEKVLQRIPIHHRIIPAIKSAHALGCDLRIVSDANTFFIETILKNLGISKYFTEINTNPGYVNQQGRLRILPYHDFNKDSHGCILCPPNMCKGLIIDRIQNTFSEGENKRFIYLGDGIGDYCPSLRLREKDFMMPRKNFPVWDLICKDPSLVKAEIHGWCDGEELEQILIQLINKIIIEENAQFISSDCKLQTLSIPVHETLPKALSVRP